MVEPGLRLSRCDRHNHLPGIQEFAARSDLQENPRAIRARIDSARARHHPALQSAAAKRTDGVAGRSYRAAEPGRGRDRLFRIENERDFRACLAASSKPARRSFRRIASPCPGRYRVVFHRKIENTTEMNLQQIAQACWNSFEPYVRKNPAPWLWMYKLWRYCPANAERPYPF